MKRPQDKDEDVLTLFYDYLALASDYFFTLVDNQTVDERETAQRFTLPRLIRLVHDSTSHAMHQVDLVLPTTSLVLPSHIAKALCKTRHKGGRPRPASRTPAACSDP